MHIKICKHCGKPQDRHTQSPGHRLRQSDFSPLEGYGLPLSQCHNFEQKQDQRKPARDELYTGPEKRRGLLPVAEPFNERVKQRMQDQKKKATFNGIERRKQY